MEVWRTRFSDCSGRLATGFSPSSDTTNTVIALEKGRNTRWSCQSTSRAIKSLGLQPTAAKTLGLPRVSPSGLAGSWGDWSRWRNIA